MAKAKSTGMKPTGMPGKVMDMTAPVRAAKVPTQKSPARAKPKK